MPIVAGVIAAAAALEEITLHPEGPLPLKFRVMMFSGLALFFLGVPSTSSGPIGRSHASV